MDTPSLNANARALLEAIQKPTYVSETPPPGALSITDIAKLLKIPATTARERLALLKTERIPVKVRDKYGHAHRKWYYKLKL